jgi:hypothetical protein
MMLEYELSVEPDENERVVRLRLRDSNGVHRGSHQVKLAEHPVWRWEALFDTQRYIDRYTGELLLEGASVPATAEEILADLGVFLGTAVLGPEIMTVLGQNRNRQALVVRLSGTELGILASAFARVPWEIARFRADDTPLSERNLVVRVVAASMHERDHAVENARAAVNSGKEPLRVLLVFAESSDSRLWTMRSEREQLLGLFENEILPKQRIEVEVLCHGVTRSLLQERITASGGYHIIHWSGYSHGNRLDFLGENGSGDSLTGKDLVTLIEDAGGFVPQIFFLSACVSDASGALGEETIAVRASSDMRGVHSDNMRQSLESILADVPGHTGTALALLRCGVPQVVAMRYGVGDSYARELAWRFYKRLLVDAGKHSTANALALARTDVLKKGSAVDQVSPLMFGRSDRLLEPMRRRSDQMQRLRPRPQPLLAGGRREFEKHEMFVGRGRELTSIHRQWRTDGGPAAALVQGLAGIGKTAFAAEAVHLWHRRFDWVLIFQAKPKPLAIEKFLGQVDRRLTQASQAYCLRCEAELNARVFLEASQSLHGEERYEQMRVNLIEALRYEAILLVLDNFETNLETVPGDIGYACADPQAQELPRTRSRLLVTSRRRPAALADDATCLLLPLGAVSTSTAIAPMAEERTIAEPVPSASLLLPLGAVSTSTAIAPMAEERIIAEPVPSASRSRTMATSKTPKETDTVQPSETKSRNHPAHNRTMRWLYHWGILIIIVSTCILLICYFFLLRKTDEVTRPFGTNLVLLGSGNVHAYLRCHAPKSLSSANPLVLEGGSTAGMRLVISAFHHGITASDPHRPGLISLLSDNPWDLWGMPGMPIESQNVGQNYFYYAQISSSRPVLVYYSIGTKSRSHPSRELAKACAVSGHLTSCIDAEEMWHWMFSEDDGSTRIGIPGSGSATRSLLIRMLCMHRRSSDPALTCSPEKVIDELPRPITRQPFDLREDLIPHNQPFFYVGSDLIPATPTFLSDETMASSVSDCPPLREDIKHAQLCQSIDASGTCMDPLMRSYFIFGKWSIAGRSFVMQEDECHFIRSVINEIDPLNSKHRPTVNCSYPLPDQPSRLTRLW